MAKIHITRMPHKKYEHGTFTIYLNDNIVGSLKSAESVAVEADQSLIKLEAAFSGKSYTKPFLIKESGDHYYNIEIREPKWYQGLKFFMAGLGFVLIIIALLADPFDYKHLGIGAFCFLSFLNKVERPEWKEVRI